MLRCKFVKSSSNFINCQTWNYNGNTKKALLLKVINMPFIYNRKNTSKLLFIHRAFADILKYRVPRSDFPTTWKRRLP